MENWKDIPGFEGRYQVSDLGRVKSLPCKTCRSERVISHHVTEKGYLRINLRKGGSSNQHYIHRLVLLAFRGPCPEGMEGCHDNSIPSDCRLTNLRWDTPKENSADKKRRGTDNRGFRNPQSKMTEALILEIKTLLASGEKSINIAKKFGLHQNTIYNIKSKRIWSDV